MRWCEQFETERGVCNWVQHDTNSGLPARLNLTRCVYGQDAAWRGPHGGWTAAAVPASLWRTESPPHVTGAASDPAAPTSATAATLTATVAARTASTTGVSWILTDDRRRHQLSTL